MSLFSVDTISDSITPSSSLQVFIKHHEKNLAKASLKKELKQIQNFLHRLSSKYSRQILETIKP